MIHHTLGHFLSCQEMSRLVSRSQEQSLTWWQRWRMRMHLTACDGCTRFAAQMRFLKNAMRKYRE